jgi:hypothetical protein
MKGSKIQEVGLVLGSTKAEAKNFTNNAEAKNWLIDKIDGNLKYETPYTVIWKSTQITSKRFVDELQRFQDFFLITPKSE